MKKVSKKYLCCWRGGWRETSCEVTCLQKTNYKQMHKRKAKKLGKSNWGSYRGSPQCDGGQRGKTEGQRMAKSNQHGKLGCQWRHTKPNLRSFLQASLSTGPNRWIDCREKNEAPKAARTGVFGENLASSCVSSLCWSYKTWCLGSKWHRTGEPE